MSLFFSGGFGVAEKPTLTFEVGGLSSFFSSPTWTLIRCIKCWLRIRLHSMRFKWNKFRGGPRCVLFAGSIKERVTLIAVSGVVMKRSCAKSTSPKSWWLVAFASITMVTNHSGRPLRRATIKTPFLFFYLNSRPNTPNTLTLIRVQKEKPPPFPVLDHTLFTSSKMFAIMGRVTKPTPNDTAI